MSTYCPLMFNQLMVDFKGLVSPCCNYNLDAPISEYENRIASAREEMLAGVKVAGCKRCWDDEAQGLESLRQVSVKAWQNLNGYQLLDIRINNSCNLACTMCNSHASSLWAKLSKDGKLHRISKQDQQLLLEMCSDMVKVSVQGGEPFYGNDFIQFIDAMPNKSNIELEIFTNLVTAKPNVIARWKQEFKHVMIIASVDGTEEVFEDIRWPAKWSKLERRMSQLYPMLGQALSFNFTVQNLNILNIKRFVDWRNSRYPKSPINFSVLEYPRSLHFTVLNEGERQLAIGTLLATKGTPTENARLKELLQLLAPADQSVMLRQKQAYLRWVRDIRTSS